MRKATTKSERKWGKKDIDNPRRSRSKGKEEMYRVMIDGSGFTKPMSYNECLQIIETYKIDSDKHHRPLPNLVIVKL